MNMKAHYPSFPLALPKGVCPLVIIISLLCAAGGVCAGEAPPYRDLFPDTWVGQDALGRNLPPYSVVGPVKKDHRRNT